MRPLRLAWAGKTASWAAIRFLRIANRVESDSTRCMLGAMNGEEITGPGVYLYTDPIGSPPERIEVLPQDGELVARFAGHEPGDELVPVAAMAGTFELKK
jgi:hypothetical protein